MKNNVAYMGRFDDVTIQSNVVVAIILSNLLFTYPSVLSLFLPIPSVQIITPIYTGLYLLSLVYCCRSIYYNKLLLECFAIQLLTWGIFSVLNQDEVYITRIVFLLNGFFALVCLWNYRGAFHQFQSVYVKLIAILCCGGTIAFVLVLFNVISPLLTYENLDGREGLFYGLTCTNAQLLNVIRYSGIFDEPGAMAFWGMMALIINEFSLQNSKLEKVIILCLVFTFSMAYYIQLFFYVIFFKIHTLKQIVGIFILLSLIITGIFMTKDSEFDLYTPTIMRFEMDDSGNLKGDNRSGAAEIAREKFFQSPIIGNGPSITSYGEYMADNQYENLATDGIVGTIVMYLPLLVLLPLHNKKILGAIFILTLGYLQRPFHQNFMHAFMLYMLSYTFIDYNKSLVRSKWKKQIQKSLS